MRHAPERWAVRTPAMANMLEQVVVRGRKAARRMRDARSAAYYRLRESASGRVVLGAAEFVAAPRLLSRRRRVAQQYLAAIDCATMHAKRGYCLLDPEYFTGYGRVLDASRE